MTSTHSSDTSAPPAPAPGPRSDLRDLFQIFDALPTGILLLDTEGGVLRINRIAETRIGLTEMDVLGRDFFRELFPLLEQEGVGERYRRQIDGGSVSIEREARLPLARGERSVWLGLRSFTFRETRWGVLMVEDRSALAGEEERRKRAERLASVGELAAGVAHEVNNPLASIRSFAQLLSRETMGTEQQRALEIIIQETTRIERVVANLLTFARQQGVSGREPVNLSTIAEQVLDLQRYALETAGIQVRRDFDTSLSPVMGEAGALQQVVLNLVVNAEQALAAKTGDRLLIVRTREGSEGVILSVVDNGHGIPRERLPHLFDAFRGPNPDSSAGIGLGTCATIVRDHAGHIWAESEEGRGAAFFVRLPRASNVPEPRLNDWPQERAAAPAPEKPRRALRVLVADDEATLRLAIALFLGRRGHHVVQAADAHEALRYAQEQQFDCALVDARMPGDGLALLEKLEQMPQLQGRTALMTGDLGRARTSQGITTGRPYLTKPFDMTDVVRLIETLGR